jgi:hypothetical protein
MGGGYSCQRKSAYLAKEVYGILKLPTNWASTAPDDINQYQSNILPEMFFGFYQSIGSAGIDMGIRMATGGKWRGFMHASSTVVYSSSENDKYTNPSWTLSTGQQLYMRAWISSESSAYYANLNISKTGYSGTDLMSIPLKARLNDTWGSATYSSGRYVNREIVIASNPNVFETSGCYLINGEWKECGYVHPGDNTYVWTDAYSADMPQNSNEAFVTVNNKRILRLRKDGGQVNQARIKVISRTNTANGATEKVSIDFRDPPQI